MQQYEFHSILKRYQQGICTPEETKIIEDWYANIEPEKNFQLSPEEEAMLQNRYWLAIHNHIQSGKVKRPEDYKKMPTLLSWRYLRVAAAIALIIIMVQFIPTTRKAGSLSNKPQSQVTVNYIFNEALKPKQIVLPDNSKINLEPGSKVRYAKTFTSAKREIYLEGKAFFEVRRDENRPFIVYTGEVITKVLGTSFDITALPNDKRITVAVRSGKVSVFTPPKKSGVQKDHSETVLTPNQQIIYNRTENTALRTLVKNPQPVLPQEEIKRLRFEEAPVTDILKALEKMYGVDIMFDETLLKKCVLTTTISDGEIFNRIDIICKAIGASYAIEDTVIVINGTGCN